MQFDNFLQYNCFKFSFIYFSSIIILGGRMKKILTFIICLFVSTLVVDAKKITVKFDSCVDGDTAKFLYKNKIITTRFLAVDTPETKHPTKPVEAWGKEASDYTCNKIKNANKIVLEYDDNSDEVDKYNRHLAWVWVDNKLLQKELISKGYAKVAYLYGNYKYTKELQEIEKTAIDKKLGIWSDDNKVVSSSKEEKKEIDNINNYDNLINSILYTKDGKLNYLVIIFVILIIIILCIISTSFRQKTIKTLKKEIKKKL